MVLKMLDWTSICRQRYVPTTGHPQKSSRKTPLFLRFVVRLVNDVLEHASVGWASVDGGRNRLLAHARVLQHVGPFPAGAGVTVFQVLAEVIGAVEFFGLVAFSELVDLAQMLSPRLPVRRVGEFLSAVAAQVR